MRVVVTIPEIDRESTGPAYTVPSLCRELQNAGVNAELHSLNVPADRKFPFNVVTYPRSSLPLFHRIGWSSAMRRGLQAAARNADILHMNGVWMMPNVYPSQAARGTSCKVVCCPRGGLSKVTFGRNRLVKGMMWRLGGQRRALENVSMFHAASQKECDEIRALGFRQPVAIIPNGIDIPGVAHRPFSCEDRRLVFFGRIHPTKAVDHLVEAWGRVANDFPNWSLAIAGPDCGAVQGLKAMIAGKGIPRVEFVGEFHGSDKYEFLSAADLYVLPSLSENFGITIAEALACGTPVVASRGCPWPGLEGRGCGRWIDIGPDALATCLRSMLATSPVTLEEMGRKGRDWMAADYTWMGVASKMKASYEWLLHGGIRPPWILLCGESGECE